MGYKKNLQQKILFALAVMCAARISLASELSAPDTATADSTVPPVYLAGGTVGSDISPLTPSAEAPTTPPALAAPASTTAPYHKHGYLELDVNHSALDAKFPPDVDYDAWNGVTVQGAIQTDPKNIWSGLVNEQREFGDSGTQVQVGNIHYFNDRFFSNLNVGTSTGGFFLPKARVEGALSRRFLPGKNLVGTVDAGYNDGRVGIRDKWVQVSGQYFVPQKPWNFEAGFRYNNSSPGSVNSHQQYVAATYGTYKQQFLTLRYNWGTEGYQVGVPSTDGLVTATRFSSHYIGLTWRKWVTHNNGFTATIEDYTNPFFNRKGVLLGAFHDFGN